MKTDNTLLTILFGCVLPTLSLQAPHSHAQSINIDYHDGAGIPVESYAAEGSAGIWNSLLESNTSDGVSIALTNTDGTSSGVTVTHTNLRFFVTPTVGVDTAPESALLGDYAGSTGPPFVLDFAGLASGTYEVLTYMVGRQDFPNGQVAFINDDITTTETVTGTWSGALVEGQSHARHIVTISDGTLRLTASNGDPILNGIQLHQIPEPSSLAMVLITCVAIGSLRYIAN